MAPTLIRITQRSVYGTGLYNLNKKAMRMWSNTAYGVGFSLWLEFTERIQSLRKRSLRRLVMGSLTNAFESWCLARQPP